MLYNIHGYFEAFLKVVGTSWLALALGMGEGAVIWGQLRIKLAEVVSHFVRIPFRHLTW